MQYPRQFIIEGIDRLGKSTLIENLQHALGYHLVIHYEKPKPLRAYLEIDNVDPLLAYQRQTYEQMFNLLGAYPKIIFDRGHLGESVYAPMYRKYSGDYVFDLEKQANTNHLRLVLLTTSDFSFIKDDGLSFDFSKKEQEQASFVEAFKKSSIYDKIMVDVADGKGGFRPADDILSEVLKINSKID